MELSPAARAARERLFQDFEYYAGKALWIRTKDQKIVPLSLNKAQKKLLKAILAQLERRGFVRLIILKGRQMGSSTLVEAFLYWWVSQRKAQRYGMTDGQLQFRRLKIAEKGLGLFQQEFPLCPEEAFMTSGHPVFHPERVLEMLTTRIKPVAQKTLDLDGEWVNHPVGELLCYLPHDPAETYYIGADVGFGVRKDYSVAQILDGKKRQAAVWRSNRVNSDRFGTVLAALGHYFNDAHLIIERNGPGILTNRVVHKDHNYPWIFQETVYDRVTDTETVSIGFLTSEKSKALVVGELQAAIRCDEMQLYDETTLKELQSFIQTDSGRLEGEKGKHDDAVMSLALANHIHEGSWTPVETPEEMYFGID